MQPDGVDAPDLHAPYDDETRGLSQRIFRSGTLAAERYCHVPRGNSPHRPDAVVPDVDICGHSPCGCHTAWPLLGAPNRKFDG